MTYTDRPEWAAHLAGILAVPEDDLRRLVLADWLEEHGEAERAEFIRVQVEQHRIRTGPCRFSKIDTCFDRRRDAADVISTGCRSCSERAVRLIPLLDRERSLSGTAYREWASPFGDLVPKGGFFPAFMEFRRGFLTSVRCRLADWIGGEMCPRCEGEGVSLTSDYHRMRNCRHCDGTGRTPGVGPAVVAAHPVERVVVTDRIPMPASSGPQIDGAIWWYDRNQSGNDIHPQSNLPAVVFERLDGTRLTAGSFLYPTAEAAAAALSDALLALARAGRDSRPA
jgi:uncharacterized protein (TIGR02996 family)